MGRLAARMKGMKNAGRILVRKYERKKLHARPRCGWDGNIIMGIKEINIMVDSCDLR
jgi:ribosomal protein L34E